MLRFARLLNGARCGLFNVLIQPHQYHHISTTIERFVTTSAEFPGLIINDKPVVWTRMCCFYNLTNARPPTNLIISILSRCEKHRSRLLDNSDESSVNRINKISPCAAFHVACLDGVTVWAGRTAPRQCRHLHLHCKSALELELKLKLRQLLGLLHCG